MPDTSGPLGILGGTFDPVHFGHLRLAEEAMDCLGLAQLRLLPAGRPLHRNPPHASAQHRLAMVQAAAAGNPRIVVDASEVLADAPSFTVPTLERLRAEFGETRPLVLLVGADAFLGLPAWHRWRDLFGLAHIAVATRPNHSLETGAMAAELAHEFEARLNLDAASLTTAPNGRIVPFGITALDISATAIRAALGRGASSRYLLPDAVLDYIARNYLYRTL